MIKLSKGQYSLVNDLFADPTSTMILSCLQGYLGQVWVDNLLSPECAIVFTGYFIFIAGDKCNDDAIGWIRKTIEESKITQAEIIPQNDCWINSLDVFTKEGSDFYLKKTCRHRMKLTDMKQKKEQWMKQLNRLPNQFTIVEIDENLYNLAQDDRYLYNFVCCFRDYEEFKHLGLGYFLMKEDQVVGGVSSFSRYDEGVEVQIAISPEFRGMGLAKICAARFLLECCNRNLYPSWDAANHTSEHIAESLGYELQSEITVYKYRVDDKA